MNFKLIADSICDLTEELKKKFNAQIVPLTLHLDETVYTDDENLDIDAFRAAMKKASKISTSCPSPGDFLKTFDSEAVNIVTTVSDKLSGTYSSAMVAAEMAAENGVKVHVVNSNSASAGEILIVMKLQQYIEQKLEESKIIEQISQFVAGMKTYFALENIDNFVKNGRLNRIIGKIIKVASIKPIMGSDGNGHIELFAHARSTKQIVEKLTELITKSGRKTEGESMVITHFNRPDLAETLKNIAIETFKFAEVVILPTNGCSSVYADDRGIIFSY